MNPLQIEVALHYHYAMTDYPNDKFAHKMTDEAVALLLQCGMLEHDVSGARKYRPTDGLAVYVERLCATPFPVLQWSYEGVTERATK